MKLISRSDKNTLLYSYWPQILILGLSVFFLYNSSNKITILYSYLAYSVIVYGVKFILPRTFLKGLSKLKRKQFEEAIPLFEKSYRFFEKNIWADKLRSVLFFNTFKKTYRELILLNIAFCYIQLSDNKSKDYYIKVLELFPESMDAKHALEVFERVEKKYS